MFKIISVVGIGVVVIALLFVFSNSFDDISDVAEIISEPKIVKYVPSDITKANPNFLIGGESSGVPPNISDVANNVVITIQGTVLEIGTPIDYLSDNIGIPTGNSLLPITITVDQVYKGEVKSETFTFYEMSMFFFIVEKEDVSYFMPDTVEEMQQIINDKTKNYRFFSDSAQFEIGEEVLVHLASNAANGGQEPYMIDDPENFSLIKTYYASIHSAYSKYQLQPNVVDTDNLQSLSNVDFLAFNILYPEGRPLDLAIDDGQ